MALCWKASESEIFCLVLRETYIIEAHEKLFSSPCVGDLIKIAKKHKLI